MANKKFNYSVVYSKKKNPTKTYSENNNDEIPVNILLEFQSKTTGCGIIGIYVHSKRLNTQARPIKKEIQDEIKKRCCVVCGSKAEIICDHKNDLYNDKRVLDVKTQMLDDFQALCNHCNLQKRQVCKDEKMYCKLYSAKKIPQFAIFPYEFPWEKKVYNETEIDCKKDSYWYDPVEFGKKIYKYNTFIQVLHDIRRTVKLIS